MAIESAAVEQLGRSLWNAEQDGLVAVVAHGLLGSVAVCSGVVSTLLEHPDLDVQQRTDLLEMAARQADLMAGVLKDLMRGVPADIIDALDGIGPARASS